MRNYEAVLAKRHSDKAAAAASKTAATLLNRRKATLNRLELLKWIPAFMKATQVPSEKCANASVSGPEEEEEGPVNFEYLKCSWDPLVIAPSNEVSLVSKETKEMEISSPMAHALNNRPMQCGLGRAYPLASTKAISYLENKQNKKQVHSDENMDIDAQKAQGSIIFQRFDNEGKGYLNVIQFKKFLRGAGAINGLSRTQFSANVRHDFKLLKPRGKRGIDCAQFILYYNHMVARASGGISKSGGLGTTEPATPTDDESAVSSPKAVLEVPSEFRSGRCLADVVAHMNLGLNARYYAKAGESDTLGVGGLPSIVLAAANGDMQLVVTLANCDAYARVLVEAERNEIVNAARNNNVDQVQALMRDLFTKASQRKHMFDAMMEEDIDLARQRLKDAYFPQHGRTIDLPSDALKAKGSNGVPPLILKDASRRAAAKNKEKMTQRLVSACLKNKVTQVKECLAEGADPNTQDFGGSTPLIHSAWYGYIGVARVLLEFGADVNVKNLRGNTAMHFCLEKDNIEMLYLFLSKGGAPALLMPNLLGKIPLDLGTATLIRDITAKAMDLVPKDALHAPHRAYNIDMCGHKDGYIGKSSDEVRKACCKGDLRRLKHLVRTGLGSVHHPDRYGVSPLMHAVVRARKSVIKYLLDQGVNIYHTTCNGNTVLHLALDEYERRRKDFLVEARFRPVIKLLLSTGGERLRRIRNKDGNMAENFPLN